MTAQTSTRIMSFRRHGGQGGVDGRSQHKVLKAEHKRTRELEHAKVTAFVIGVAVILFLGTFVAAFNR